MSAAGTKRTSPGGARHGDLADARRTKTGHFIRLPPIVDRPSSLSATHNLSEGVHAFLASCDCRNYCNCCGGTRRVGGRSSPQSAGNRASRANRAELDRLLRRCSCRLFLGRWDGDLTFDPGTGPIVVFDPSHRKIDANGWLAGGQIRFNYQLNSFVFGLEADASWTNLKGSGSFNTIPGDVNWSRKPT